MHIVAKLRSTQRVHQYDAAGRLIEFDGEPTDREREAADYIEKLETGLRTIGQSAVPRKACTTYRDDGQPSKHDLCRHSRRMYEDCDECTSEYARSLIGE